VPGPPDLELLVLGSGVAGLSAAVRAAAEPGVRVGVLTKAELAQSATRWAQGGVAAVLGGAVSALHPDIESDSTDLHLADTLAAGSGLCDVDAVRVLVDEGPGRVVDLIALGAQFDLDPEGALLLAREGGHSKARVVHAGGAATGAEVERALVAAVERTAAAVLEGWFALELLVEGGRCRGVVALSPSGDRAEVRAGAVLLATGGAGALYAVTTNPTEATGDGVAMAVRAGVAVADVEFMQFHPTALHHPAVPRPLLSEALRGHGALLRDARGERFVDELLPRDRVSRAMTERMLEQGAEHLWLDATALERFDERFPTIAASVREAGLDPATDWLPVAPAAHYLCGGAVTDLDGATTLPGLWACGEVACTGVHGANRLASNSLLEGMVFAPRAVEALLAGGDGPSPTGAMRTVLEGSSPFFGSRPTDEVAQPPKNDAAKAREGLQRAMTEGAGVLRTEASLAAAGAAAGAAGASVTGVDGLAAAEVRNLATVAAAVVAAATARTESRGCHWRADFPEEDPAQRRRLVLR
jgi:L-aspartate oxidase